ncbi:MAG: CobD/CbiB family protein [Azonexus sp.]|nr:CobD/CbiB family protein [Azonexus sp.]
MSLFSLIAVFLLEQFKPLDYRSIIGDPLSAWADFIESRFNAGTRAHGMAAWLVAVALPVVLIGLVYGLLYWITPVLAWVFNVLVLYLTMGFRQFSHHYTDIQIALREGELERARGLLRDWQGIAVDGLDSQEIARLSITGALAASHRHVFAVLLWFVLLPGPCGAVLYRLAVIVRDRWVAVTNVAEHNDFSLFAQQVFGIIDWLPLRVTAAAFAIVGDFEDAVYCWRTQPAQWPDRDLAIVLASGAGALGVSLAGAAIDEGALAEPAELGLGEPADADYMQSAVGLVWRATVLWMLLLFLLGLASLAG